MIYEISPEEIDEPGAFLYQCSRYEGETDSTDDIHRLQWGMSFKTSDRREAFKAIIYLHDLGRVTASTAIDALLLFSKDQPL